MDLIVVRVFIFALLSSVCYFLQPFGLAPVPAAAVGAVCALAVMLVEMRVRALSLERLVGAAAGGLMGTLGALMVCAVLRGSLHAGATQSWLQLSVLLLAIYVGLVVGASKGELLKLRVFGETANGVERAATPEMKLVDTSAIIDGRIADVAEAGFLPGTLMVPEFVLVELQLVADSSDSFKRQRGRRGLDVLQRMQDSAAAGGATQVEILREDVAGTRAVDLKLIELGKKYGAKILTTDFNLNKVAHLHGVEVLNINDLAGALKPVVLPGERMNISILKEGKEQDQGVGYLDDGTMVVVDHARKLIGRTVEIGVTSVLQTASGKMIFGKLDGVAPGEMVRVSTARSTDPQPMREVLTH